MNILPNNKIMNTILLAVLIFAISTSYIFAEKVSIHGYFYINDQIKEVTIYSKYFTQCSSYIKVVPPWECVSNTGDTISSSFNEIKIIPGPFNPKGLITIPVRYENSNGLNTSNDFDFLSQLNILYQSDNFDRTGSSDRFMLIASISAPISVDLFDLNDKNYYSITNTNLAFINFLDLPHQESSYCPPNKIPTKKMNTFSTDTLKESTYILRITSEDKTAMIKLIVSKGNCFIMHHKIINDGIAYTSNGHLINKPTRTVNSYEDKDLKITYTPNDEILLIESASSPIDVDLQEISGHNKSKNIYSSKNSNTAKINTNILQKNNDCFNELVIKSTDHNDETKIFFISFGDVFLSVDK